jgi:hypothetical protein
MQMNMYATIDADGRATGFFISGMHPIIPDGAVAISPQIHQQWAANPSRLKLENGELVACDPPPLSLDAYRRALVRRIDAVARERSYDNGVSCASYASSTNETWAAEAAAFVSWRDAFWTAAYAALDAVEGGAPPPTVEALLASMPAMVWPA